MEEPKQTLIDSRVFPNGNSKKRSGFQKVKKSVPWVLLLLVIVAAGALVFYQHKKSTELQKQLVDLKENPQKATEEETSVLLDKIGKLIELPDEQPTIATVNDLAPLKDQPFFAHAQIGDKVLIYSKAKKAVLYRPSTNKVIEVAPVNLDQNTSTETTPSPTEQVQPTPTK